LVEQFEKYIFTIEQARLLLAATWTQVSTYLWQLPRDLQTIRW